MFRYLVVTLAIPVLSGCASMDREECMVADWRAIGFEDGAKGHALSYLGNHRKACAEYGVTPDMERYEQGRLAGLQEYCTPINGFKLGKAGDQLNPVCKPPFADEFKQAWSQGIEIFNANTELRKSERVLNKHQKYMSTLQQQIDDTEAELIKDGISSKRRKSLLEELKALGAEREDAESELSYLRDKVDENRDYLEQIESRYQY
jgi:hypothetical protein